MTTRRDVLGRGGGGGSSGSARAPYEAPNTLRSKATATILDVLGEGPIEGPVSGMQSVFLNDVQLQATDGTFNYKGINIGIMGGLPDQGVLPGFDAQEHEVGVGTQVKVANGPVVKTINTTPLTAVRVTMRIPALLYQNKDNGDLLPTQLHYTIEVKGTDTAWSQAVSDVLNGKCVSPYEKSYRIPLPGSAPWQVRVTRITPDKGDATNIQNDLYWASYTEILEWKLSYPDTAYAWMTLDSELLGGQIPQRSYEVKGLKIKIPSNYNPVTRVYTGLWDGTFQIAWTNNPAWIFYDLLTNTRYGLGHDIPESAVDKWALYQIAQYCDEQVPDGMGGMETRFEFNGVLNTPTDAWSALQTVAACFRGMCYYGAGLVTATQDAPGTPVKLVTNANVIGGQFSYEGTGNRSRHTLARVTFSDKDDNYRPSIEPVESDDIADRGIYPIDVSAIGTTKRTQARRIGKWILDSERSETETITYQASWDHADVRPGDLILVADRWYAGARMGGRIASATANSVTLDYPVELAAGQTYQIRITQPDGTVALRDVTNGPGTNTTITFVTALTAIPNAESVWLISGSDVQPRTFRVVAMTMPEKNVFEISGLFHDTTKYARVEQNMTQTPPTFTRTPTGALTPPSNPSVSEYLVLYGGAARAVATLSWQPSTDPRTLSYQVEVQKPGYPGYEPAGETQTNSLDVYDLQAGSGAFRVRALSGLGGILSYSQWVTLTAELEGIMQVPEDVSTLDATVLGDRLRLAWTPVREHAFCFYTIRYNADVSATAWESAIDIERKHNGTSIEVPLRDGIYMVKALTYADVPSANPIATIVSAVAIQQLNAILTLAEAPTWSGTKTDLVVSGAALQLAPGKTSGTYVFDAGDFGAVYTSRVTASLNGAGITAGDYMAMWTTLAGVIALQSGTSGSSWSATLEYRYAQVFPADDIDWSNWLPFQVADITARTMQFRLTIATLDGGVTLPEMYACSVSIDLPDRVEGANNVVISSAGTRITFATPFRDTPAIAVTGQSLVTGDYWQITGQDSFGFNLRFFTAAGAGVSRTADWIAKGYGRRGAQDAAKKTWDFSEAAVPTGITFARASKAWGWRSAAGGYFYSGRSTKAWAHNSAGVLTEFAAYATRVGYNPSDLTLIGILREVTRTNYNTNPRLAGATTGVLGSGGVVPTGITSAPANNGTATANITAQGVSEDGIPYVEIRIQGTTSAAGYWTFFFPGYAPAVQNQIVTSSVYCRCVAGTMPSTAQINIEEYNSGLTFLGYGASSFSVGTGALRTQRYAYSRTMAFATTASCRSLISFNWTGAVAVDFTVRIGLPQLEVGGGPTTPIMPEVGTLAASTRLADCAAPLESAVYRTTVPTDLWYCSRPDPGTYFDSSGTLQTAAAYIPRYGYDPTTLASLGALNEAAAVNYNRNTRFVGSVVGNIGSGGVIGTGWSYSPFQAGSVVGRVDAIGTEDGIPYIDLKVSGATHATLPGAISILIPYVAGTYGAPVVRGNSVALSVHLKLQAGTLTGISNVAIVVQEMNSAGTFLTQGYALPTITSGALRTRRTSLIYTASEATAAWGYALFSINIAAGQTLDCTLRIGGVQLEAGVSPTSFIMHAAGVEGTVVSRGADFLSKMKLVEHAPDEPRFEYCPLTGEYLGLLVEATRTNLCRNARAEGAVAGTPGTRPTNWSNGGTTGQTIIGTGTIDGIPYIELEVVADSTTAYWWEFPEGTNPAAAATDYVMFSAYVQMVEGDFSNCTTPRMALEFINGSSVTISSANTLLTPTRAPLRMQRFVVAGTAPTGTATIRASFATNYTGPVRFRVRIGGIMIEKTTGGAPATRPSSLILPPVGTTSSTPSRSGDAASDADMSWLTTTAKGTTLAEVLLSAPQGNYPRFFEATTASNTESIRQYGYPTGSFGTTRKGSTDATSGFYGLTAPLYQPIRAVFRWNQGALWQSWNGLALQSNFFGSYAGDPALPFTTMGLGHVLGGGQLDGWLRRVSWYVADAATDAEMRSLSTPLPRTHQAAAFLAGAGRTVNPWASRNGSFATLSGAGTVAAAPRQTIQARMLLSGAGTITPAPRQVLAPTAALAGAGTVAAQGTAIRRVSFTLSGVGSVLPGERVLRQARATLTGAGTITG